MAPYRRASASAALTALAGLLTLFGPARQALAQAQACRLDEFRARIDRTLGSIVVRSRAERQTTNAAGKPVRVIDFGLTGDLDGCVVLQGPLPALQAGYSWLYDVPDVSLPQEHLLASNRAKAYPLPLKPGDGNTSARYLARGQFKAEDGAGMDLFLPMRANWNGQLFIAQRGSGVYDRMKPHTRRTRGDPFPTASGANIFVDNMIDRGYAVAYLRKDAVRPPLGVTRVRLSDSRELLVSYAAHVAVPLAFAEFAQQQVNEALGQLPQKTYYYGHSGGGITGRLINYSGANVARDGSPIIDGLILDDSGNGLYLPVRFEGTTDTLLTSDAERKRFVPQIEIARKIYNPVSYLPAKRLNDDLLEQKSLGALRHYYEVRGASHFDAGMQQIVIDASDPAQRAAADPNQYLELSGLMTAMIDNLDAWVRGGVAPPASNRALALPEVSCPLGVYYSPASGNGQLTRLAAFDGRTPRPDNADNPGAVDEVATGAPEQAETVSAAWRRLRLIPQDASVSRELYLQCLRDAGKKLISERFLPTGSERWYEAHGTRLLRETGAKLQ